MILIERVIFLLVTSYAKLNLAFTGELLLSMVGYLVFISTSDGILCRQLVFFGISIF